MRGSRRSLTRAVCVATAVAFSLVGCSSNVAPNTKEAAVSLNVDAPKLAVLSEGSDDKVLLEFKDKPGDEQAAKLEIADGFSQQVANSQDVDPQAPAGGDVVTLEANALAKSLTPEARNDVPAPARQVDIEITEPNIDDLNLTDDIRSINNFVLGWDADKNGRVAAVHFAAPKDATDEGRVEAERYLKKFISLPVILPTVPVGPGAQWSIDNRVAGDSTLLQTTTYTLKEISGDFVDVDVSVEQRPAVAALSLNGQAESETESSSAAGQLKVLSSQTTSIGSLTLDLNRPLPTDGQVSYTTRIVYGEEGSATRVVQDLTSSVKFLK